MAVKSLVVGANSFIGSKLICELIKQGHEVVGIYHQNADFLQDGIINIQIDHIDTLTNDFDDVYLLSAYAYVGVQDIHTRTKLFQSNVALVHTICNQFNNARIIFCSSVMVYKPSDKKITEFTPAEGLNEYGITKLWAEKIVALSSNYAIVRLAFVYGNGMKLTPMIPSYIKQALNGGIITVWGKGERAQDYLHVTDAVHFLIRAGRSKENGCFLATSNISVSNLDIAKMIAVETNSSIQFEGKDDTPSFYFDNSYTGNKLSYQITTSMEDGLKDTIQWIKGMS